MTFDNGGVMFRNDRSVGRSVRHPLTDRSVGPFGPTYVDLRTMCGTRYMVPAQTGIQHTMATQYIRKWQMAKGAARSPRTSTTITQAISREHCSIAAAVININQVFFAGCWPL
jgi:hypothetical protein